ncbi:MAG: hypothetical protein U0U69_08930 [Acidimicrobiia bacterium]
MLLASGDQMAHVSQHQPPTGNIGLAIALDQASMPSVVYLGVENALINTNGEVHRTPIRSPGVGILEGLGADTRRPLALTSGRSACPAVLLAVVEQSGIWRRCGPWQRAETAAAMAQSSPGSPPRSVAGDQHCSTCRSGHRHLAPQRRRDVVGHDLGAYRPRRTRRTS